MSVGAWSGSLLAWEQELEGLKERLGPIFRRREVRESASAFLDGLLSGIDRKTGWMMAEQAGLAKPYRMQSLLGRSRWDSNALRDGVRDYAIEALGDRDGVLVVDETGFIKKERIRLEWPASTRGRPAGSRIVRSGFFLAMPVALVRR